MFNATLGYDDVSGGDSENYPWQVSVIAAAALLGAAIGGVVLFDCRRGNDSYLRAFCARTAKAASSCCSFFTARGTVAVELSGPDQRYYTLTAGNAGQSPDGVFV